jgi:hypothetical protein
MNGEVAQELATTPAIMKNLRWVEVFYVTK